MHRHELQIADNQIDSGYAPQRNGIGISTHSGRVHSSWQTNSSQGTWIAMSIPA
jgi:hypothetical protein